MDSSPVSAPNTNTNTTLQPASTLPVAASNPQLPSSVADTLPPGRRDKQERQERQERQEKQEKQVRLVVQQLREMDKRLRLSIKTQQQAIRETVLSGNLRDDGGETETGPGMVSAGA
ncbi:hypothetical protein E4U54_006436 [Claviceps lovelessii]|nr:hypothetical protein E4U54_006436 [Claviceps lovelessii]